MGITNTGMAQASKLLRTDVTDSTPFNYIAIGTSATAFAATQTALIAEQQRNDAVGTLTTTAVTNDTLTLTKDSFSFGGSYTIQEVGVLQTNSGSIMLCRTVITAVSVTATDTLKVIVNIQSKQGA